MRKAEDLSLLELMASRSGCTYLSDLRYLDELQRGQLFRLLEKYPADTADLREWNDALDYLTGQTPEATAEAARTSLLRALKTPVRIERNSIKEEKE